jgi:serine/threonine kinase 16
MSLLNDIFAIILKIIQLCIDKLLSIFRREELIEFDNGRKVYLGKKIADGGFSVVFKARDYHSDDKKPCFALKRIVCGDNEMVEKCREEARVHQAFNHPNLLPLLGLKIEKAGVNIITVCYMLFPLLQSSVRDEITERGLLDKNVVPSNVKFFKPRELIELFGGVVDGVLAMHERGFTHRDIKVENIMLDRMETPILMDFGSVGPLIIPLRTRSDCLKLVDDAASHTTMPYRAPELFDGGARYGEGEPDIDGKVDVWSLGCVLFALMYGVSPFECEFRGEQVVVVDCSHLRVLGSIPTPDPSSSLAKRYDDEFIQFVKCLLTQDRALRPSIEEVVEKVDDLLRKFGGTRRWKRKNFMMASTGDDDFV